mgnify:CR=1 FL=1
MAVATTTILVAAAVAIAAASSAYAGVAASEQADAQADQAKAQAKLEEWQRQKAAKAAREQTPDVQDIVDGMQRAVKVLLKRAR